MVQVSAPGMHCDGCTATVEETLAKMQGVDSVHADLESKEVTVYCDTTQTARAALVGMIDRLGFSEAPGK
ncbi:heavy-metal-associated domain-containing protein [bacterium]|nr:heavy-metal-associated domain-containing protein [bacterium]